MFSDENKSSSLAEFLLRYDYVIIDTCSLMEDGFPLFMDVLVNAKDYLNNRRIVIYGECLAEIKKHSKNRKEHSVRIAAKRALKILHSFRFKRFKPFEYTRKSKRNKNFADNVIYVDVSQRRITQKILVITQDKGLAGDLRRLNELDSQHGRKVAAYKILPDGTLDVNHGETVSKAPWKDKKEHGFSKRQETPKKPNNKPKIVSSEALVKAIDGDRRLKANLTNNNYPDIKKVADIEAQLALLSALKGEEKKSEQIHLSEAQLKEELAKRKLAKPESKKEAPKEEKKAESPKIEKKPEAPKEAKKPSEPKPESKNVGPRGEARKLDNAIRDCATKNGVLIRDASVPYFAQIHGPVDMTENDIPAIEKGLTENPKSFLYKGVLFTSEANNRGFSVWMNAKPAQEKPAEPKKEEAKLVKIEKEAPKSPFPKDPRPSPKKEAKEMVDALKKPKRATKKKVEEEAKADPKPAAKKPAKKKAEPVKEKEAKAEEPAKAEKPAKKAPKAKAETKEAPAKKPSTRKAKAEAPKEEEKAKPAPKKAPAKKVAPSLETVKKSEARLLSVVSNSNYPLESKQADVKSQLALVKQLKSEDVKSLKLDAKALEEMLKGLK